MFKVILLLSLLNCFNKHGLMKKNKVYEESLEEKLHTFIRLENGFSRCIKEYNKIDLQKVSEIYNKMNSKNNKETKILNNLEAIKFLVSKGADIHNAPYLNDCIEQKSYEYELVEYFLKLGVDPNKYVFPGGRSEMVPLSVAASRGNIGIVNLLLNYGADINIKNNGGYTSLNYAIMSKNYDIARLLIENGAFVKEGYCVYSFFWPSTYNLEIDFLKLILNKGASPNIGPQEDHPLNQLVAGSFEFTKKFKKAFNLLLKHGADINAQDKKGRSPLHFAIENSYDITKFIISKKAVLKDKGYIHYFLKNSCIKYDCRFKDKRNDREIKKEILDLLLDSGIDPNEIYDEFTPLTLLMNLAKDFNFNEICDSLKGDYLYFKKKEIIKIAKILLEKGANINLKDKEGYTPLYYACIKGNYEIVKFLLKKGAKTDNDNYLHACCKDNLNLNCLLLIINKVKDLNELDERGNSVLHILTDCYINKTKKAALKLLLTYDVDVNIKNKSGLTPLNHIIQSAVFEDENSIDILKFILSKSPF